MGNKHLLSGCLFRLGVVLVVVMSSAILLMRQPGIAADVPLLRISYSPQFHGIVYYVIDLQTHLRLEYPPSQPFNGLPEPKVSPDGKWTIYYKYSDAGFAESIEPTSGGEAFYLGEIRQEVWSEDNRLLAYIENQMERLIMSRPDGSERRVIADSVGSVNVSPDRQWLTFLQRSGDDTQVYVMPFTLDGEPRLIMDFPNQATALIVPVWLPDSHSLLVSAQLDGQYDLYHVDLASPISPQHLVGVSDRFQGIALLAPNGRYATVQVQYPENDDSSGELYLLNLETGGIQNLTKRLPGVLSLYNNWSPNSKWLAFRGAQGILLYNVQEGTSNFIDGLPDVSSNILMWSPDSNWIIFESGPVLAGNTSQMQYYVLNVPSRKVSSISSITTEGDPYGWYATVQTILDGH